MTQLTGYQVADYARAAGFRQPELSVMVAIAFAESGFRTDAKNPNSSATGLWQILASHKEFAGWDLTDPAVNARAAKVLYDQNRFNPWASSAKTWEKKENLSQGMVFSGLKSGRTVGGTIGGIGKGAADALIPDEIQAVAGGTVDAAKAVGGAVGWLSQPANLRRVAYVVIGGQMLLIGVALIAFPMGKVGNAVKGFAGKTPVGAAVKSVTQ